MRVDKIMAYLSSTTYADHTEELGSVQQIKREDIPYLESCLDRLLDLLVKGKYEGLQKGLQFDELVQEWQRLCDVVKTREGLLLEKLSKVRAVGLMIIIRNEDAVSSFRVLKLDHFS